MSLSCTFLRYREILVENRRLNLLHLYLAPPLEVTSLEFRLDFRRQKTRVLGYCMAFVCVILHLAVLIGLQYRRVTDGRMVGQTDGHTTTAYTL